MVGERILKVIGRHLSFQTLEQAMNEIMYVAVSSQVQEHHGEFFVYGKTFPAAENDPKILQKLWNLSLSLTEHSKN
jgi:hypothetical protein